MMKNINIILFGLAVLSLISVLESLILPRVVPLDSRNYCAYESEPEDYDGVQTLGFTGGITNMFYL